MDQPDVLSLDGHPLRLLCQPGVLRGTSAFEMLKQLLLDSGCVTSLDSVKQPTSAAGERLAPLEVPSER